MCTCIFTIFTCYLVTVINFSALCLSVFSISSTHYCARVNTAHCRASMQWLCCFPSQRLRSELPHGRPRISCHESILSPSGSPVAPSALWILSLSGSSVPSYPSSCCIPSLIRGQPLFSGLFPSFTVPWGRNISNFLRRSAQSLQVKSPPVAYLLTCLLLVSLDW